MKYRRLRIQAASTVQMIQWLKFLRGASRSFVVFAVVISGCAYHEPYPGKWALIVNDPLLCTHVNGEYTPHDYRSRLVISWVAGNAYPEPPAKVVAADRLGLRILGNTLTATAYLDGATIAQKQYDIQCGGDSLVLDLGRRFQAGQGTVGYESTLLRIRKDASGSLVVSEESAGVGAYGPIPFAGSSSAWVGRFRPYDPNAMIPQNPIQRPRACEYSVSQIFVDNREDAESVEQALGQGASFEQLAATRNRPFLRLQKGLLGWISPNIYPKWAPIIAGLKKGEYSRTPVRDEAGWHIIKVNDVRPEGCIAVMTPRNHSVVFPQLDAGRQRG